MKRPYYIPPIVTAGFIALGFLAMAASSSEAEFASKPPCIVTTDIAG